MTESMEQRYLFSGTAALPVGTAVPDDLVVLKSHMATPEGYSSPDGAPITPALMRDAYGLGTFNSSSITFNGSQGTGAGQTIALIEGGSDPDIAADLAAFDSYWGLPAPPSLNQYNATGGTTLPPVNGDQGELDLDVEWAHVIAPQASLVIFDGSLYTGMTTAADWPGVSVISVSYGISGTEGVSEFQTPSGHNGVTFLGAAGDSSGDVFDPSKSPAVVAVGGTALTVANNAWSSETGWSASGGGVNTAEAQPMYQSGIVSDYSTAYRVEPDVAMDADPGTGVGVYDEYDNGTTDPWSAIVGGTSLATPMMGALVAIADQGRIAEGLTTTLDGYTQTLPRLYQLYAADESGNFHSIAVENGTPSYGTGYNENGGVGSPIGNNFVPDLAGGDTITGQAFIDVNGNGVYDAGTDTPLASKTVYLDLSNTGVQTPQDPTATTNSSGGFVFTDVIGSFTGKVRLAGSSGYLQENTGNITTAYDGSQTYNLAIASSTTYAATANPTTVTGLNSSLGVTVTGTVASGLTYTWTTTTSPAGSSPTFSPNGTAASQNSNVTFNEAGSYVFTVLISNSSGGTATSNVSVTVNQTLTSVTVSPTINQLTGGSTLQLTGTALDQFGNAMATQPTFNWSVTSGNGSIGASTGLYTAPTSGTLATVKAADGSLSATTQIYVVSSPWIASNVGSPALTGTAFDTSGVFNISGGGTGVAGANDQFEYIYRALGGNGTIIAEVNSQTNTNASAGAGVMIRSSLASNAAEVSMGVTPGSGAVFLSRDTTGGITSTNSSTGITAPYWVKLVRNGNIITGYDSTNGSSWVMVSSAIVPMSGSLYIGMYDTSHNAATASVATISNVTLMIAADQTVSAVAGTPVNINVLASDVAPTGDTLSISGITQGTLGSVTNLSNGTLNYSTSSMIAGTDTFTYTIGDGAGDSANATVTVNILGLLAYYKMNEGAGTTTADATGNGNTATIDGATWTTGVAGDGLAFNGSGSEVTLPTLNISSNTVTFSGWFDSSGTQNIDAGLIFNRNGSIANGVFMYSGTTLGYAWGTSYGSTGLTLPTGTWTFVAMVVTPTNLTVYTEPLGGSLSTYTKSLTNAPQNLSSGGIVLGYDTSSSSRYYTGSMDEVRIYNTNLSSSAITVIAGSGSFLTAAPVSLTAYYGSPGTVNVLASDSGPNSATLTVTGFTQPAYGTLVNNGSGSFTYTTTSLIAGTDSFTYTISDGLGDTATGTVNVTIEGMIAEYLFNEGSGLAAIDSTGDYYTGTISGATYATGLTGLSTDHALAFNGAGGVTFSNSPSLGGTGDFTAGAWIKTTSTAGGVIIQQRDPNGFEGEYQLGINTNGTVYFYLYNNGYQFDITSSETVNNGSWNQITAIRNSSGGGIYINGALAGSGSGAALALTNTISDSIGYDLRGTDNYYTGSIDNGFIADDALSAGELALISKLGPTVSTAAAAAPGTVTANTTVLSVAGSDYYESATPLTYSWAVTSKPSGATTPTFSSNANSSASSTTATFYAAGTYVFVVTLTDQSGLTTTSTVSVRVSQTATTIAVTPASVSLAAHASQTFSASETDQFGNAMSPQPTFVWSSTGSGSINSSSGAYVAGYATGTATVTATAGALSANASVTVTDSPPVVAAAAESPSPVTGKTANLFVTATDDGGPSSLTYTWSTTGSPPAAVTFSPNGTSAANASTATFIKAGSYTLLVTVTDEGGLSNTSSVSFTVNQTLTSIVVSPAIASIYENQTQAFTEVAYDQFSNALTSQPTVTWSKASGVGTVNTSTGLYTAPAAAGSATVNASSGSVAGSASVTVLATAALNLSGPAFYLKQDANGNIDVWNNNTGTGTMYESLVPAAVSSITVTGTGTANSLTVDFSNGDPLIASGLNFNGNGTAHSTVTVLGTTGDTVNMSNTAITVAGTFGSAPINFNSSSVGFYPAGSTGVVNQAIGTLTVASAAQLVIAAPAVAANRMVLVVSNLNIAGTTNNWLGQLDLTGNDMIVPGGNLSTINNQVASGYNNGTWTGEGITSSTAATNTTHLTALGAIANNNGLGSPLDPSFDSVSVALNTVLIKYTYYGDSNLDGQDDGSDYTRIDNGYTNGLTGWFNGSFNYAGIVNGSDYTLMDNAFNTQGARLSATIAIPASSASPAAQIAGTSSIQKPKARAASVFNTSSPITINESDDDRKRSVEALFLTVYEAHGG